MFKELRPMESSLDGGGSKTWKWEEGFDGFLCLEGLQYRRLDQPSNRLESLTEGSTEREDSVGGTMIHSSQSPRLLLVILEGRLPSLQRSVVGRSCWAWTTARKKKKNYSNDVCVCVFEWKERWCYHSTYVTLVMSWLEIKHFTSSCSSGFTVSLNLSGHRGAVLGFGKPLDQHQKWVLIIKYFNSMYHTLASWALRSGSMGSLSFENWICTGWGLEHAV